MRPCAALCWYWCAASCHSTVLVLAVVAAVAAKLAAAAGTGPRGGPPDGPAGGAFALALGYSLAAGTFRRADFAESLLTVFGQRMTTPCAGYVLLDSPRRKPL